MSRPRPPPSPSSPCRRRDAADAARITRTCRTPSAARLRPWPRRERRRGVRQRTARSPGRGRAGFAAEAAASRLQDSTRWTVDGIDLQAPPESVFVSAVVHDFEETGGRMLRHRASGRGHRSGPARRTSPRGSRGHPRRDCDLRAARGPRPRRRLPPSPTACERVGKRAVLAELGVQCAARTTSAPARWVAVVAARRGRERRRSSRAAHGVRFAGTVLDPPGAPALSVEADTADRDGDGLADVALRVTLEGGGAPFEPGPRVSATLAWLDRPAGLSRDVAATEVVFRSARRVLRSLARAAAQYAPTVPRYVAQARALWRALCSEGGAPASWAWPASGCHHVRRRASRSRTLGLAEARSYVTQGDALRAALAIDRAERPPAAHTPARANEAVGWLAPIAPVAMARSVHAVAAVRLSWPGDTSPHGARSRSRPAASSWCARARESCAWTRMRATRPTPTARLAGRRPSCRSTARCAGSRRTIPATASRCAPPLHPRAATTCTTSRCRSRRRSTTAATARAALRAGAAAWRGARAGSRPSWRACPCSSRRTCLALRPSCPSSSLRHCSAGRARRDGKTLVVPTSAGLVVRGPARTRLLRAAELDGATGEPQACTVSYDGAHVACMQAGKAWVGTWDAPAP